MSIIKDYSQIILIVLCIEFFIITFLCLYLQNKVRQHEKEINNLELRTKGYEKQMDLFLKKANTMENSLFMQELRRTKDKHR